ncbi:MAG TPA: imidazole glycerol phosphate synthase subunit HisF [Bacteroidota bacterium]|nr:imidazole glycerol phosphate synthase subunit HisF [Bacteroidota bacterium]
MLTRRIIPCLDVLNNRVVKGVRFQNLTDAGDPVELAAKYSEEGADEIVLLDISATLEGRGPFLQVVENVARRVAIPLTVGGGIRSLEDILELLKRGADKVSLNSVLARDPTILSRAADRVGCQALVGAIDAVRNNGSWHVRIMSGTQETSIDAVEWAATLAARGAGELLVTSMDNDGTRSGYDLELLARLAETVRIPVVASGGAGTQEHILQALETGKADAVLAASIFHFNEIRVSELKKYLSEKGIAIRI